MPKNINITDLLSNEQPTIQIGEKQYPVNNSIEAVMKFEELATDGNSKNLLNAIKSALGDKAYDEIGVGTLPLPNIRVLTTAILAATQGIAYEDAAARFQQSI